MKSYPDRIRVVEAYNGIPFIVEDSYSDSRGELYIKLSAAKDKLQEAFNSGLSEGQWLAGVGK